MTFLMFCLFFPRGLDTLRKKGKGSIAELPIDSVSLSLQDLIGYFQPPGEHLEHEVKQNRLRALKNRQNLFQEEVRSARVSAGSKAGFSVKTVNSFLRIKHTECKIIFFPSVCYQSH